MVAALALAAACHSGSRAPTHHRLQIEAMAFGPAALEVVPGDTVTWVNRDLVPHTVTNDDGKWDSGDLAVGASFTWIVRADGIGGYHCTYHPLMRGTLRTAPNGR